MNATPPVVEISSKDNPLLRDLRRLMARPTAYRQQGQCWLEGEHLCDALRRKGLPARQAVVARSAWDLRADLVDLARWAARVAVVPDALMATLTTLESPPQLGFVLDLADAGATDAASPIDAQAPTVILDRLQDPGNVGSILRSAAALGCSQVLALEGTVALWSTKVLRAGMGAHFSLRLFETVSPQALQALEPRLVATSSHEALPLHEAPLPRPCVWVFGHEGRGVDPALAARAALRVRIPQPGGEESLNVAAAAAICLYESARRG